jgi:hypothetical protein
MHEHLLHQVHLLIGITRQPRGDPLQLFHNPVLSHSTTPRRLRLRSNSGATDGSHPVFNPQPTCSLLQVTALPSVRYANKNKVWRVVTLRAT